MEMEQVTHAVVGNSIVKYLELEGVTNFSLPGAPLSEMRTTLRIPAVKIVICGIPDIMAYKGADHVCGQKVTAFEKELEKAAEIPSVILCTFYPARSLRSSQWGIVHRLNSKICKLNAAKGEGTPNVTRGVFGRQTGSSELYFKKEKLMDEAHPGKELADAMSECIKQFIWTRIRNREARGVLELRRNMPEQDLRRRLEGQRERRLSPVERQEREREDGRRERSNETGARARSTTRKPDLVDRKAELRRNRDDREEEIRREVKAEMEKEIEAVRAKYREIRNQRLEENDQKYRRDVEDLELEEERLEHSERQERHRRRDRHSREEETRFRSRDSRDEVEEERSEQQESHRGRDRHRREEETRFRTRDIRDDVPRKLYRN